jgi:hypothetical protein
LNVVCAPVLELADRPALHAGDLPGRPGPIPGRGTFYFTIGEIMPKARKTKPKKRGPKEQRLIIRDDPAEALARLLNKPARKR